jgi:hypothetical protein
VLSEDEHLTPEGTVTGIDWRQHFEEYREYLDCGIQNKKQSVVNLFREWNEEFFRGGGFKTKSKQASKKGRSAALNTLMDDDEIAGGSESG